MSTYQKEQPLSVLGVVLKTIYITVLFLATSAILWNLYWKTDLFQYSSKILFTGLVVGLFFALVTAFNKTKKHLTIVPYAICQGLFVGSYTFFAELSFPGIVLHTALIVVFLATIYFAMYMFDILKLTHGLRRVILTVTGAILAFYVVTTILNFYGIGNPFTNSSTVPGICFSIFVVTFVSLTYLPCYNYTYHMYRLSAGKYVEWQCVFLMSVSTLWLTIETIHLLTKLNKYFGPTF